MNHLLHSSAGVSEFGGMEWWNGTVEWNGGMEQWNGGTFRSQVRMRASCLFWQDLLRVLRRRPFCSMVDEELGKEGNPIILDSTPPRENFIVSPRTLTGPKVKFPLLLELQDRSMARYVEFPLLVQYQSHDMSVMLSCTAWVINFPVVFPVPIV